MKKKYKIVYLYSEIMGYTLTTCKKLVDNDAEVHIFHWDHKKLSEYNPTNSKGIFLHKRSRNNYKSIKSFILKIDPDLIVVSGWMDKTYLRLAHYFKKENIITICALDSVWNGSIKQRIYSSFSKLGLLDLFFSKFWIPGIPQYNFLKNLGINDEKIIYDFYSADTDMFGNAYKNNEIKKLKEYPHKFLFVGRFTKVKGIDRLANSWKELQNLGHDWELILIGNGDYFSKIRELPNVKIKDFLQPTDLIEEIEKAGCFILPSIYEPWGVVVHEFSAAGCPLILSNDIGAKSTFLIDGFNGFSFKHKFDNSSMIKAMKKIINKTDEDLIKMSKNSHKISRKISPTSSAKNLISVLQ